MMSSTPQRQPSAGSNTPLADAHIQGVRELPLNQPDRDIVMTQTGQLDVKAAASNATRIGIVGAGQAAGEVVLNLAEKLRLRPDARSIEVWIFDPRGRFSAADAFGTNWRTARLNTDPTKMGSLDQPGDFAQRQLDQLPTQPGDAMERRTFGEDQRAQVEKAIRQLAEVGVLVRFCAEEVTEIRPQQTGNTSGYVVVSLHGFHDVDFVILAPGRLNSPGPPEFAEFPSFIANPWAQSAMDAIQPSNRLLIIGVSLSTVDLVGRLDHNGHNGQITAVARTRGLPTVQNIGDPYRPSVFTHASIEARTAYGTRRLTWDDVLALFYAELVAAGVADTNEGVHCEILKRIDLARRNPHAALLKDIAEAQAGQALISSVIRALNDATRFAWPSISDADALRLLRHKSLYSMFANPMPLVNAQLLERVLAKGLLRVHVGLTSVTHNPATRQYTATITDTYGHTLRAEADTLIRATGNSRRLADGGPLIRQMLAANMIREHPRGGVDITPAGRVIRTDGSPAAGLWWIGEATEGARLGTNCVRVIKHHTRATVEDLASVLDM